ncbi:glycosyltransferase family 2 protein [Acinetobacter beijerinckii]|uniref:glycosyltransferase family 2 protein n=1 Tax=Acinetobacter TaxID=469 RepID=UPI0020C8B4C3|nr:glycosyltransferase family 2 protein [Acinetobacter sp. Z1]UTO19458.1 glycosyltransferase [Acinetobacter sp. Z1]
MSSDLVSIIMPAYNASATISDSIESVLSQSYKQFELIVIDDCSLDNTKEIVERYVALDQRIKLISKDKNEGVAYARNNGIDHATGNYVAFLDSDDMWDTVKLEKQINVFLENKEISVVFSSYYRFNTNGINKLVNAPVFVNYKKLLKGNCIGNLTGIYKLDKATLIRQKKIGHEDYLFWLEVLSNCPNAVGIGLQEPLAFYRVVEDGRNLSGNKVRAAFWTWKIYRRYLKIGLGMSIFYFFCYIINATAKRV